MALLICSRGLQEGIRDCLWGASESGIRIRQGRVLVGWHEYIRPLEVGKFSN